jgi:hypothetical protein
MFQYYPTGQNITAMSCCVCRGFLMFQAHLPLFLPHFSETGSAAIAAHPIIGAQACRVLGSAAGQQYNWNSHLWPLNAGDSTPQGGTQHKGKGTLDSWGGIRTTSDEQLLNDWLGGVSQVALQMQFIWNLIATLRQVLLLYSQHEE